MDCNKYCDICGKKMVTDSHHLIGGTSERRLSDMYKEFMCLGLCRECHSEIHNNNTANKLSKMLGQALYELNYTHEEYMKLFKKNYLP